MIRLTLTAVLVKYRLFKFFARNINLLTFSGLSQLRQLLTSCPPILNTCSEATLVAHMQRYLHAAIESIGILLHSRW